ncbi:vesicular glutamate transporter 2.1-like isoform X1 [Phymastichus coffea]|uniref:vesicular glutamate transporter 2.1-like isoform X1 n=1 Tax=Phymastichus coffea TaxID=108790 RepID=UPI00273CECE6|nr:vesicular glutamate transporter 2.1-like isoform X1 [Phymastichus coffea]
MPEKVEMAKILDNWTEARRGDSSVPIEESTWRFWRKRRYVVGVLAFFGFFVSYVLRVNLSVAIVKMTANRTLTDDSSGQGAEFEWDSRLRGLVLSSFFYGYMSTQLLGGWLASRVGGKRVFGFGIAVTALFSVVSPPIARCSVYLFVAVRIVEGICEGVTYPCIHAIWANWAPPLERSKLATLAFSGSFVGTVFAMPVCGTMAERLGWPSVFYGSGAVGLLWYVLWTILVRDHPDDDPRISRAELEYIKYTLGSSKNERVSHPWTAMLLSPAVWAIVAAHFSENWGFYTMLTQLPTFVSDVLDFELEKAGLLSALPYLVMALVLQLSGQLADNLRSRNVCSTTQVRKIFNCGAFVCQTIFMACTAYTLTPVAAVTCITIAVGLGGFAWSGFSVNYLDIAPKHASVIMGIGQTVATLPGILSPLITGYIVRNKTPEEWQKVFLISSAVYFIGALIFGIFASGEKQPWAVSGNEVDGNQEAQIISLHCRNEQD